MSSEDTSTPAASSSKLDSALDSSIANAPNHTPPASPNKRLSTSNAPRLSFTPASPIPRVPSAPVLPTPTEDRTAWPGIGHPSTRDAVPASARTSFSRVDATRVGTPEPVPVHDEAEEDQHEENVNTNAAAAPQSPSPVPEASEMPVATQASLTFLTVSGLRRTMAFDPDAAVGRVKELVWSSWPSEWPDARPPAPGFLRILHLGKILDDEDTLAKLKISTDPALPPTIVHLSIRSAPPPGEEDVKKSNRKASISSGADDEARAGGCCGCIIS